MGIFFKKTQEKNVARVVAVKRRRLRTKRTDYNWNDGCIRCKTRLIAINFHASELTA